MDDYLAKRVSSESVVCTNGGELAARGPKPAVDGPGGRPRPPARGSLCQTGGAKRHRPVIAHHRRIAHCNDALMAIPTNGTRKSRSKRTCSVLAALSAVAIFQALSVAMGPVAP